MQGSLIVRTNTFDAPYWEIKWRDKAGKQIKRRVPGGDAWLERDDDGTGWVPRAGRPTTGSLSRDMAVVAATKLQEDYEAQEASRIAQEALGSMSTATFSDVAALWLHRAERRGRKRSTVLDYRQVLDSYLTSGNGNVSRLGIKRAPFVNAPITSLDNQAATILMRGWFDEMPPSRTRDKLLTITRGILRFAVNEGYIGTNVALRVDRHQATYTESYDCFDVAEIKLLLAATTNQLDRVLFATVAMAGLRRGELIALHWRDIDWEGHKIIVRGNVHQGRLVSTKSGHHRYVPLVPELANMLATIAPEGSATKSHRSKALVFSGTDGGFMDPSALRRRYLKAAAAAGLRPLPFHSLRHHFASQAIQVASVQQVRSWCGHSDIRTTSRYLHSRSSVDDATLLAGGFS